MRGKILAVPPPCWRRIARRRPLSPAPVNGVPPTSGYLNGFAGHVIPMRTPDRISCRLFPQQCGFVRRSGKLRFSGPVCTVARVLHRHWTPAALSSLATAASNANFSPANRPDSCNWFIRLAGPPDFSPPLLMFFWYSDGANIASPDARILC